MADFISWNWPFAAASALMFVAFLLHVIVGGQRVAKPLLAGGELDRRAQMTLYYVWHMVSVGLLAAALVFLLAALRPEWIAIGWAAGLMVGAFALVSFLMTVMMRLPWHLVPQWLLFVPIAALALWGATR